jgi:hypothetical protein
VRWFGVINREKQPATANLTTTAHRVDKFQRNNKTPHIVVLTEGCAQEALGALVMRIQLK